MTESIMPLREYPWERALAAPLNNAARKLLFSLLSSLRYGRLTLRDGDIRRTFGGADPRFPLEATIVVHDPRFYGRVLVGGSVGAGEAYMAGYWSADDLTAVIRIIVLNESLMTEMEKGWARLSAPFQRAFHRMRKDTRAGSRANIAAHYDLGNEFYRLFLDETLTYSCGIFEGPESTLAEASIAKYDRICRKLGLSGADHLLEIGTGWGGFAIHAAGRYGCRVTTTTISGEQHRLASERVARAGLSDRVMILSQDYRDLAGSFDKLVSIEMIEAVGHHFYDDFFRVCAERLKPDGAMALQAIVIRDDRYRSQLERPDFIKRHIFPGACLPSIAAIADSVARVTDLRLFHLEDITPHYARTLSLWRERFFANLDRVRELGYPEPFIRMWEFYLCYCEGSFLERYIGDVQMILTRPLNRMGPILPAL